MGKTERLYRREGFSPLAVTFPRKANDEVGRQSEIGNVCAGTLDQCCIRFHGRPATHAPERLVTPALKRQMQVGLKA